MEVFQSRFGPITVDPDTIIQFPDGLPGFEDCKRFKLLHEEKPNPVVQWLQSLDDAAVAFSVVAAEQLGLNYQITLSDDECFKLALTDAKDAQLFLMLSRPEGEGIKAHPNAPLIINTSTRLGLQKAGLVADIIFRNGQTA